MPKMSLHSMAGKEVLQMNWFINIIQIMLGQFPQIHPQLPADPCLFKFRRKYLWFSLRKYLQCTPDVTMDKSTRGITIQFNVTALVYFWLRFSILPYFNDWSLLYTQKLNRKLMAKRIFILWKRKIVGVTCCYPYASKGCGQKDVPYRGYRLYANPGTGISGQIVYLSSTLSNRMHRDFHSRQ